MLYVSVMAPTTLQMHNHKSFHLLAFTFFTLPRVVSLHQIASLSLRECPWSKSPTTLLCRHWSTRPTLIHLILNRSKSTSSICHHSESSLLRSEAPFQRSILTITKMFVSIRFPLTRSCRMKQLVCPTALGERLLSYLLLKIKNLEVDLLNLQVKFWKSKLVLHCLLKFLLALPLSIGFWSFPMQYFLISSSFIIIAHSWCY